MPTQITAAVCPGGGGGPLCLQMHSMRARDLQLGIVCAEDYSMTARQGTAAISLIKLARHAHTEVVPDSTTYICHTTQSCCHKPC